MRKLALQWGFNYGRSRVQMVDIFGNLEQEDRKRLDSGLSWCLGEDFNVARNEDEKIGLSYNLKAMNSFSAFLDEAGLVNLPRSKGNFTWGSKQSTLLFVVWIDSWLVQSFC
ncbi:hypothetical protein PTKIN_Ptkin14bG0183300 [Pterospermum kingtungense]